MTISLGLLHYLIAADFVPPNRHFHSEIDNREIKAGLIAAFRAHTGTA